MAEALSIFLSYHDSDAMVVRVMTEHLQTLFGAGALRFTDRSTFPVNARTVTVIQQAVEAAPVVLVFGSAAYFNYRDTLLERDYALRSPQRPLLIPLRAKATPNFPEMEPFTVLPADGSVLSNGATIDDLQCALAARTIADQISAFLQWRDEKVVQEAVSITWPEAQARLFAYIDKNSLRSSILLLHRLIKDPDLDKIAFETEAEHQRLHRRTQQERLPFEEFLRQLEGLRRDLEYLVERLEPRFVRADWAAFMESEYFGYRAAEHMTEGLLGLSTLADQIIIPETSLRDGDRDILLSDAQRLEYKRLFILAQDADAMGQHGKAFAYADQIRNTIDPESAQLYEHLMMTFVKKETPDRIIQEAIRGNRRLLDAVILYAGRFQEYQRKGKCPSPSGYYNASEVAAVFAGALYRFYAALPNDHLLDTGLNAQRHADTRPEVLHCLQTALDVYYLIHPNTAFLDIVLNELCGGGRYQWADTIILEQDEFRLVNRDEFDLSSRISVLYDVLCHPEVRNPDDAVEMHGHQRTPKYDQHALLRDNLRLSLERKRKGLKAAIAEERRYFREFIDERASLIGFVYANIIGYHTFDKKQTAEKSAFLNLALDELLRQPEIPWFTLDDSGALIAHPDSHRYAFSALAVVEKIVREHAGMGGWAQARPQIHETVFHQYVADIEAEYNRVATGLQWRDIRRWHDIEARQAIIRCLRRWEVSYKAVHRMLASEVAEQRPEQVIGTAGYQPLPQYGEDFLQKIIRELIGGGLMLWVHFDPEQLTSYPDSIALGYPATTMLAQCAAQQNTLSLGQIERQTVENLFQRRILPAYNAIKPGDEAARPALVRYILEALRGYRTYQHPDYIDWVYGELTGEKKLQWVDIDTKGRWGNRKGEYGTLTFSAVEVLEMLARLSPARFGLYATRQRLANQRYREMELHFHKEISPYPHQNGPAERLLAIQIFERIKGIFLFFPDRQYLDLPIRELDGNGRIRWQTRLLGVWDLPENHHENLQFRFDYKATRVEFRMYWETCAQRQQELLLAVDGGQRG
jgi:hypothetical protein